jgi:Ni/Co efflux regulator RcnB
MHPMRAIPPIAVLLVSAAALPPFTAVAADAMKMAAPAKPAPSDAQLVASAVSAAPAALGKGATVVVAGADGKMRTVRPGSNHFTCMPDNPVTPGRDPMCMDSAAMGWVNAWIAHQAPPVGKVGLMYMLAGGTDASNTDPYAEKPAAGNHWIKTGPHIMLVGADAAFYDAYPKDADPDTSQPYVMWAGTPYQHLMAPVK